MVVVGDIMNDGVGAVQVESESYQADSWTDLTFRQLMALHGMCEMSNWNIQQDQGV